MIRFPNKPRQPLQYPICDGLSLRAPVVQAPLGGCDGPRLVAAVSRAGGLGALTVSAGDLTRLPRLLAAIRARTPRPFIAAFQNEWERDEILDVCFAYGVRHFQVFWWNGPRLAPRIKNAGGTVFWQVGTTGEASDALMCGADVLVAQGTEAGGQVRSPLPVRALLAELRALTDTPLIAGGGLATRADVMEMLTLGARAAYMGTRFLLTEEAAAPAHDKTRLLRAQNENLVLDPRSIGTWPCAPRRRLNLMSDRDIVSLYAGLGVEQMTDLPAAADIVRRLTPKG